MQVLFNTDKLMHLITNLQSFTGIRTNTFDSTGKDIQLCSGHTAFCSLINAAPGGHARCEACDARAVKKCMQNRGAYSYRCHAGICETLLPVFDSGSPIAYLVFGQLLDDSPLARQWENTLSTLDWYEGDLGKLKDAFFSLRRMSSRERDAYGEILFALAKYIQQEGLIRSAEYTDLQKLEMYLDSHYMEDLSLKRISADLRMGTTKLCALAKQLSSGKTLTKMISERRVSAAKLLLLKSDEPISSVADKVGFSDYNYFTRIFRSVTGVTPGAYRKAGRS